MKKQLLVAIILIGLSTLLPAQKITPSKKQPNKTVVTTQNLDNKQLALPLNGTLAVVKDIDKNIYHTIKIGNQIWMVENLNVTHYSNGDNISKITAEYEWDIVKTGAFANQSKNSKNGKLYNFQAVTDKRNLAPAGWRIATDADWTELENYLLSRQNNNNTKTADDNYTQIIGGKILQDYISVSDSTGTYFGNQLNFNAVKNKYLIEPTPLLKTKAGSFWTSTEFRSSLAWSRSVANDNVHFPRKVSEKKMGLLVRCVKGDNVWEQQKQAKAKNDSIVKENANKTSKKNKTELMPESNTVTDIDNNVYPTVQIGNQIWMAENLNVSRFRNGDKIPKITNPNTWEQTTTSAYCDYNNKSENSKKYGKLYNFHAVADPRNIAPEGWHIPTDAEWNTLEEYLIAKGYFFGDAIAGNNLAKSLSAATGWDLSIIAGTPGGGDITKNNTSKFAALPGSFRSASGAFNVPLGRTSSFWTCTDGKYGYAWNRYLINDNSHLLKDFVEKELGLSIRCIKGELSVEKPINQTNKNGNDSIKTKEKRKNIVKIPIQESARTVKDVDNNVYKTIQIGNQIWMTENLKTTRYRNGDKIPNIKNAGVWESQIGGALCDFQNNPENGKKYGKLYNFYAVADERNLAPEGWHVASDAEWNILKEALISNGYNYDGTYTGNLIGKALAAPLEWQFSKTPGTPGYADSKKNNISKFNALPSSYRSSDGSFPSPIGQSAHYWTSSYNNATYAWSRYLTHDFLHLSRDSGKKNFGYAVRCVKD